MWRYLAGGLALAFLIMLAIVARRTGQVETRQVKTEQVKVEIPADAHRRLGKALQFRTITKRIPARLDSAAYEELFGHLENTFSKVHASLDTTHVHGLSRLYTWEGRNPSLAPIVLMAHVDVVPVEDSFEWTYPPFSGRVAKGHVWGRGALDDKASAVGILQALELLLRRGVTPQRTVHVAFGHDEEVGGPRGGSALAERIMSEGPSPALVVDEGGAITRGALPGLDDPLAVVGVAGKGYLTVELTAEQPGGHSSVPPKRTSIEVLNEALSRLLENPMSSRLSGVTGTMFDYVAPEMNLPMRSALSNRWLTGPILRQILSRRPGTRAVTRTTMAPTRLDAGVKDNVIPTAAQATVNFRILPSQSVEGVLDHVRSTLGELPIQIDRGQASPPRSASTVDGPTFRMLQRTIGQVTADSVVVAPYLIPGTTDSRYYADDSEYVYRFVPYELTAEDRSRIHGLNERIAIEDYRTVVRFYMQVIRNADLLPTKGSATPPDE